MTKTDGHTIVARSLKSLGVTHVYSVAGTPIRETFSKCAELAIRPIGVRHQQAGVMMAPAQNYVSGRLAAVALFSAGPAITMFRPDIRYDNIMRAFGGHAEHVERAEELIPALQRAAASGKASCIKVRVDPFAPVSVGIRTLLEKHARREKPHNL